MSTSPPSEGPLHVAWFSKHGFLLHGVVLVVCTGCSLATWWQLTRALGGNGLSWAYTFEWPCFGLYAIGLWWRLLHERAAERRAQVVAATAPPIDPAFDDTGTPTELGRRMLREAAADEARRAAAQGGWHPA